MADSNIRLPSDGLGKSLQTFENTVGGAPVHAQGVVLVDPGTGEALSSLEARMWAKSPLPGYRLGLDTTNASHIYIVERPVGATDTDPVCQGIRVPKVSGQVIGFAQVATGFAWASRTTAGWT